jgi:hypothetical protein
MIMPKHRQRIDRRAFLLRAGLGFGGVALGAMLHRDGYGVEQGAWSPPDGRPHFAPKAKSVIWLFMVGGTSHVESFDPKPALNKYAGKSISETSVSKETLDPSFIKDKIRTLVIDLRQVRTQIYPLQVGYSQRGESGIEVSDWWPHVGSCIDDIAVVRSMWCDDIDHGAQLQFHTGRNQQDGYFPTIGSWVHYGLGTLNENLPQFVVLGQPIADCCGGNEAHLANYLGPQHDGVPLTVDTTSPLPFASPGKDVYRQEQQGEFALLDRLNRLSAQEHPGDEALAARIKSYELAFRMQSAVPQIMDIKDESPSTLELYGINGRNTDDFGRQCLLARRFAEAGVRYIECTHGNWDQHNGLKARLTANCGATDQPMAGLLADLEQRGMLDETLVVWGGEFGRTPHCRNTDGRDHNATGFSFWMAGGGIKGGIRYGATDPHGIAAVEGKMHFNDLHATMLHLLGLDHTKLTYRYAGRDFRLTNVAGRVPSEILA